jgi:signal transduction histidine kinase
VADAEQGDAPAAAPGLDEQLAGALRADDLLGALLSTAADTLDGVAVLFARSAAHEPFVAVARADRSPAVPEAPPARPIEPPALLDRLRAPGASLRAPTRQDPAESLDAATTALLEAEGAGSLVLAGLGEHREVDGAIVVTDAGRRRPFVAADADVLAALALTLAPAASRARHELLHRSERKRRQAAEARVGGTHRVVELVVQQLDGALLCYRADGTCTLAAGPALSRLARSSNPIGRPLTDILVPEPALLAALARAQAGEASTVLLELGSTWLDVRIAPQLLDDGSVAGGVVLATDATAPTRSVDALRTAAGEAEAESEQRAQALGRLVEAEQQREDALTSAIHDDVLQLLSALGWRLDALATKLEGQVATEAAGLADQVREASHRLGAALDDVGVGVTVDPATHDGFGDALQRRVEAAGFADAVERRVIDETAGNVPNEVADVVLAIAGEAAANAAVHADARVVEVTARSEDGGVAVVVRDDGRGFDPGGLGRRVRSRGIALMREQARAAGGWVRVESRPGRGTTIHAWVPLR